MKKKQKEAETRVRFALVSFSIEGQLTQDSTGIAVQLDKRWFDLGSGRTTHHYPRYEEYPLSISWPSMGCVTYVYVHEYNAL